MALSTRTCLCPVRPRLCLGAGSGTAVGQSNVSNGSKLPLWSLQRPKGFLVMGEGEMSAYEYFMVTEAISESKKNLAEATNSKANGLELADDTQCIPCSRRPASHKHQTPREPLTFKCVQFHRTLLCALEVKAFAEHGGRHEISISSMLVRSVLEWEYRELTKSYEVGIETSSCCGFSRGNNDSMGVFSGAERTPEHQTGHLMPGTKPHVFSQAWKDTTVLTRRTAARGSLPSLVSRGTSRHVISTQMFRVLKAKQLLQQGQCWLAVPDHPDGLTMGLKATEHPTASVSAHRLGKKLFLFLQSTFLLQKGSVPESPLTCSNIQGPDFVHYYHICRSTASSLASLDYEREIPAASADINVSGCTVRRCRHTIGKI
ncbi:hypothetical protein Anapl_17167 [Anas platyrhynchos]|uniref:Uncharacterized protein n=1 Tax=Anas platyrhynchos TaxID=8839 RepID=R0JJS6_ANAPL|nr:hypothetical protein Anapl_17167 [Anas platyrhynchos]